MNNQAIILNIGDEIGFVQLSNDVDSPDRVLFFPVCEVTTRDGERAYRYMYPNGEVSASAIRQSELKFKSLRVHSQAPVVAEKTDLKNLICLDNRQTEFFFATQRGFENAFEVYEDWEIGYFIVKNLTNKTESRVSLEVIDAKLFSECSCKDFKFKKRICKHIAQTLQARMFNLVKPSRSAGCKGVNGYKCGEEVSSEGYCGDCLDWLVDQAKEASFEADFSGDNFTEIMTDIF